MEDQGMRFGNTQNPSPEKLMTVADVAAILNRSRRYVHDHAREMGALRVGGGPRRAGRLRFRAEGVRQFISQH